MDALAIPWSQEDEVVVRAQNDRAAFAALYDHYFPRVYSYVRYRVTDPDVADDVTARVFEQALRHLDSYEPQRGPFGAWLFAIARNAVRDHLRRSCRLRWLPLEAILRHPSPEPGPGEQMVILETRHRVLVAVRTLGEREQEVVALKFGAGLTNRRIAALMELSESNVGVILFRAIRRLRRYLEESGVGEEVAR